MKILIYTSTEPGYINEYNISKICSFFSDLEIIILRVRNKNRISFYSKFKQIIYELFYGVNYFKIDNKKIAKYLNKKHINRPKIVSENFVDEVNDKKSVDLISDFNPDLIIQAGAGILQEKIFKLGKIGTINLHHGFSPEIRGMNSTFWCLYYGLYSKLGATCHFIDKGIDTGAIINQYSYNYQPGDSFFDIQLKIILEGSEILIDSINSLINIKPNFNYTIKEVKSYYFSNINYLDYNALRKNDFRNIEIIEGKKSKIFVKKIIEM